ncbi:MAG: DciA family protein [Propionibacteriaceae bacterium]|nr:DciA family protein [Propionibacteriaceae bacterium]
MAAAGEDHDPTGVDLARQIAASVSASSRPGVRKRRRKPRSPGGPQSSGAHPDDRDPMLIGTALDRLVEQKGWNTQVNIHLLLGNWPKLVGPVNADHSRPEAFDEGVLTVRASSTAWATQLRLFAPQLVARLNAELGDGSVTRVVVKGPDAPSWKHGRRSVQGRGPRDTYG